MAGPVLVTARSVLAAATVVEAVAVLLPGAGSAASAPTVAVSVRTVPAARPLATATVSVTVAEAPAARVPIGQLTAVVQPAGLLDTNVTPTGRVSVTVTPVVSDGPSLVTVRVYEACVPGTAVTGPVLSRRTSAEADPTVLVAEAVLFVVSGSVVPDATATVLSSMEPAACAGSGVTCSVTVASPPAGTVPTAHVTGAPEQLAPVAPASVTPAGRVSVRVTAWASDGPALLTETV